MEKRYVNALHYLSKSLFTFWIILIFLFSDTDWARFNGKLYTVFNVGGTFEEAKSRCENNGAQLPKPRNDVENTYLATLATKSFYLDLTNEETDGNWRWTSDTSSSVTYFKWKTWERSDVEDEPNGGVDQSCVIMFKTYEQYNVSDSSDWADHFCSWSSPVTVCEKGRHNTNYITYLKL